MTDTQLALFFDYSAKSPRPLQLGVGLFVAPHMKHEVEFELHGSAECGRVVRAQSAKQRGIDFWHPRHLFKV